MSLSCVAYPHMVDRTVAAKAGITLLAVDAAGVTVATARDQTTTRIDWPTLCRAAGQPDAELSAVYAAIHAQAADRLAQLPRQRQGLRVDVVSRTGGATYEVEVRDASGRCRRDVVAADEGGSHPHHNLAEREAAGIRRRLLAK